MTLLSWFDNRTLFSCQLLLATVFSIVFFGMRRSHPNLRGIGSIAFSFLIGASGILLLFLRGEVPDFLSMSVANALVFVSFALEYRAVVRFLGVRGFINLIWAADAAAMAVIFYFSEIQHNIVPRIIAASLAIALARGLMSFKLLRKARVRANMRFFGVAMALFAIMSLSRAVIAHLHGAPQNYLRTSPFQTLALAGDLIYICLLGIFFFTMVTGEVLAVVRDQSERDLLSGALNRRGIDHRLAIELKRIERSTQKFSVALIDIDYFKAINDTAGHAAGDDAIREVVMAVSAQLRVYDLLGRYGGDEFLLILPQTTSVDALLVAERVRDSVRSFSLSRKGPALTLSIGLSEAVPGEHSASLLSRADQALYEAKHAGRNCTRIVLPVPQADADPDECALINVLLPTAVDYIQS